MKLNTLSSLIYLFLLGLAVFFSFYLLMPKYSPAENVPETEFSTDRALMHLEQITEKPHYIGSDYHREVRDYLLEKLQALGLETEVQEGFTLHRSGTVLAKPKNIVATIPGSGGGKSLLFLAHYDSAPHSKALGASDAGSGIVVILEGVRAFLASGKTPVNDIIILFSDAEEIGLMGAKLFVEEHPLAENLGLVVNFEARGSGGPSNMILETNKGNAALVEEFVKANPSHPVATSLMYSVYKMLPNDTDSTVFREEIDVNSFFFAFIDDHYDYHTARDNYENLDRNTLKHQGTYLMAVLDHFSEVDLGTLTSAEDVVYFNFPLVDMVSYPFSWIFPMLLLALLLFIAVVLYGISRGELDRREILKGFIPFIALLVIGAAVSYFGWQLLLKVYPHYGEMLHGFTYNGHLYIVFFVLLTLSISFWLYSRFQRRASILNLYVAPLFIWILINAAIAVYLKGAAYFIIPVFFGITILFIGIWMRKPNPFLVFILLLPAIFILAPLIQFFPVGLGLKMLFISALFTVLLFGLLLPLVGLFRKKRTISLLFLLTAIVFLVTAHFRSGFNEERPKPNSLVYFYDADNREAYYATYDKILDPWTEQYLGENPKEASTYIKNVTSSKYGTSYRFASEAPYLKNIPEPEFVVKQSVVVNGMRNVTLTIIPRREVNRISIFADTSQVFQTISFNGKFLKRAEGSEERFQRRTRNSLLSYYVTDRDSLEISYSLPVTDSVHLIVQEISFDLLSHPMFDVPARHSGMMPKPFITTDAVIIQKSFSQKDLTLVKENPDAYEEN